MLRDVYKEMSTTQYVNATKKLRSLTRICVLCTLRVN